MTLLTGEHDMNSIDCWCHPEIVRTCSECFDAQGRPNQDCWKCGGRGLIAVDAIDVALYQHSPYHEPWTIVHREGWLAKRRGVDAEC